MISIFILVCLLHGVHGQRPDSPDSRQLPHVAGDTIWVLSACPPSGLHHFADLSTCDGYYTCLDGRLVPRRRCPAGLHFNKHRAAKPLPCDRPEHVNCEAPRDPKPREFICPIGHSAKLPYREKSVHRSTESCREFFVCVAGVAKRQLCHLGEVFNEKLSTCTLPEKVPECENYYNKPKESTRDKEEPKKEYSVAQDRFFYDSYDPKETVLDPVVTSIVNRRMG